MYVRADPGASFKGCCNSQKDANDCYKNPDCRTNHCYPTASLGIAFPSYDPADAKKDCDGEPEGCNRPAGAVACVCHRDVQIYDDRTEKQGDCTP